MSFAASRRLATAAACTRRRAAHGNGSGSRSSNSRVSSSFRPRAIRVVPLRIISVSKGGGGGAGGEHADALADAFMKRIGGFNSHVTELRLKPNPRGRSEPLAIARDESVAVLASLSGAKTNDMVVCLDERGRDVDAYGFARLLARAGDEGRSGVSFLIGGAYGHDESVRKRADVMVSLSPLVFSHSVARVVLLEQLYRGYTQLAGHPYHHA